MKMGSQGQRTWVIVEAGGVAPVTSGRVLAQLEGESMPRFVHRVRTAVSADHDLQRVILVAGTQHDFSRIAARSEIARIAAQRVAALGGGSLTLAASDARGELAQRALAEILGEQIGNGVALRVAGGDAEALAA